MSILYKIIGDIAHIWWVFWSNLHFKDKMHDNISLYPEDRVESFSDVPELLKKLYKKFDYTPDGIDQLWDAIMPPPQNYLYYHYDRVKDDCDGFHSLVLHCLHNCGIPCYLLSVCAHNGGHCVALCQDDKLAWHVIDYTTLYSGFASAEEAIADYNKIYLTKYKKEKYVWYNGIIEYDYRPTQLKFKRVLNIK